MNLLCSCEQNDCESGYLLCRACIEKDNDDIIEAQCQLLDEETFSFDENFPSEEDLQ